MSAMLKTKEVLQRRVVITGAGMLTGLGVGLEKNWQKILQNQSACAYYRGKLNYNYPTTPAGCQFPQECFEEEFLDEYCTKHLDSPFFAMANCVVREALESAKLLEGGSKIKQVVPKDRLGLITSSMFYNLEAVQQLKNWTAKDFLMAPPYGQSHILALEYGIQGFVRSTSNACSSSLKAMGDSYRLIKDGFQDIMICGGFDQCQNSFPEYASSTQLTLVGRAEDPLRTSRPFDKRSNGTVAGDGGCYVVMESLEGAINRGAPILAEVSGFDCFYLSETLLRPSTEAIQRAMVSAINDAGWRLSEVDLVNAHGSGTPFGNKVESKGIKSVFCTTDEDFARGQCVEVEDDEEYQTDRMNHLAINALKGYFGHMNLASGIAETIVTLKMLLENTVAGTFGLEYPMDETLPIAKEGEFWKRDMDKMVKYTMGFGGNMAAIALEKWKDK